MAETLPTLVEMSKRGWTPIYDGNKDLWTASDRVSGKCTVGANEVDFIRYSRAIEQTDTVVINHGGPLGAINEGWRYFFDPYKSNLIFPLQYREGHEHESQKDVAARIVRAGGLAKIVESLHALIRPLVTGKIMMVGSSWGATVSLAFSTVYPELVSAIVISSPILPMTRSLSDLTSETGCFLHNPLLRDFFLSPILNDSHCSDVNLVFERYFELLSRSSDTETCRHFSSLFYAAMGDFGRDIKPSSIPKGGMSRKRAMAFSFMAYQKKPFLFDENIFIKGLKTLRSQSVPIHIVLCREDRFSNDDDVKSIVEYGGANLHKVPGGHSAFAAKQALSKLIRSVRVRS